MTITGALRILQAAELSEEQGMAIIQAIAEMQPQLFDAIGKLESRFEKQDSGLWHPAGPTCDSR